MAGRRRSERARARAMAGFVAALEKGAHVIAAAQAAGVHVSTPYRWRKEVAGFAEAWEAAVEESALPVLIAPANGRALQKRRTRRVRFTRERKEKFLAYFAATCNAAASADVAGVCIDTVWKHLQSDPAFAEAYDAALGTGHQILRAEMVAQQRATQEAYKIAPDPDAAPRLRSGQAEDRAADFERNLKLLESWQRRDDSRARWGAKTSDPRARGRPGRNWWDEEPSIEEVRAEVLRKVEAMERHQQAEAARRGPEQPSPPPGP